MLTELLGCQIINEVYIGGWPTFPQVVEIQNPSTDTVWLDQWGLSNNQLSPFRFVFRNNTKINPFGYYVVTSREFGSVFNLSQFDWLYLTSPNRNITSKMYIQYFTVATGMVNPLLEYFPMKQFTPGSTNSYPFYGPLVISEVFFNSEPMDQYIVLQTNQPLSTFNDYSLQIVINYTRVTIPIPDYYLSQFYFYENKILIVNQNRTDSAYPSLPLSYSIKGNLNLPTMKTYGPSKRLVDGFSIELWNRNELIDLFVYNFTTRTPVSVEGFSESVRVEDTGNWNSVDAY